MSDARIIVVGGGPAGLAAADRLSEAGYGVDVHERMATVGRKFLLAGKSGLNLTHAEDFVLFAGRYGAASASMRPFLESMPPQAVRDFADSLGADTFTGSSGRVFPRAMKASPLLRAWIGRLAARGVRFRLRSRWTGFGNDGALVFDGPDGTTTVHPPATVLALGGASWPRLGSDGGWTSVLSAHGVRIVPLRPANMGFDVGWSEPFATRFAGHPVKTVAAAADGEAVTGEFVVTRTGIEGSLVYALSASLRDRIEATGHAAMTVDLLPGRSADRIARDLGRAPAKASFSTRLRKATGLDGVKAGLVRECLDEATRSDPQRLAAGIKALPIDLVRARPIGEAISTAGGVALDAVDGRLMLTARPGVFVAGEMLDWEAPTGGYLLTGCFATGRAAADGAIAWLRSHGSG